MIARARGVATGLWWRPAARVSERAVTLAIVLTVAGAWVTLIAMPWAGDSGPSGTAGMPAMPGMAAMPGMPGMSAGGGSHASVALGAGALGAVAIWTLMVVAMMLPSALPAVRHVAANSLRWRRQRAMLTFVSVYLSAWILIGVVVVLAAPLWSSVDSVAVLAAALALAAGWELTPAKRRGLRDCHRSSPLPPRGASATRGVIRFGLRNGWACVRSCWALMLVMALASSAMTFWMIVLTGIVTTEKLAQKPGQATRTAALLLASAAFVVGVSAAFG